MANAADWSGRVGQEWADKADALDLLLGPFGDAGLAQLGDVGGKRVLDLGCGAGATSVKLADLGATVTGVDVSEALLDVARTRDPDMRCGFILGDAAHVEYARRYDAMYSRCGSMFFDEPVAAFRHIHAYLRDRAQVVLVAWTAPSENEWATVPLMLAAPILGTEMTAPSPSGQPGPFAWADDRTFMPILARAGFGQIEANAVEFKTPIGVGDADDPLERGVEFCMRIGPLASRLRQIDRDLFPDLRAALAAGLTPFLEEDAVHLSGRAWIITAKA